MGYRIRQCIRETSLAGVGEGTTPDFRGDLEDPLPGWARESRVRGESCPASGRPCGQEDVLSHSEETAQPTSKGALGSSHARRRGNSAPQPSRRGLQMERRWASQDCPQLASGREAYRDLDW